jgi:hypothetical protein
MNTYFERIDHNERRESEWRLLHMALLQRRSYAFHRGIIATILWILGTRP